MTDREAIQKNVRDTLKLIAHFSVTGYNGSVTLHFADGQLKQEKVTVEASIRRFDGGRLKSDREIDELINCVVPLDVGK